MRVKLEGITLKGKNKVSQHGELWNVLETNPTVHCLGGKIGFLLESIGETLKVGSIRVKDKRWVAVSGDDDFKVEIIDG